MLITITVFYIWVLNWVFEVVKIDEKSFLMMEKLFLKITLPFTTNLINLQEKRNDILKFTLWFLSFEI